MKSVPVEKIKEFEEEYLNILEAKHRDTLDLLKSGKINEEATDLLEQVAGDVASKYANS